jgi:hypothetical protein
MRRRKPTPKPISTKPQPPLPQHLKHLPRQLQTAIQKK